METLNEEPGQPRIRIAQLANFVGPSSGGMKTAVEALADAVLRVAAVRPDVRRSAARARAEQFSWDRTIAAMLALHGRATRRAPEGLAEHSA